MNTHTTFTHRTELIFAFKLQILHDETLIIDIVYIVMSMMIFALFLVRLTSNFCHRQALDILNLLHSPPVISLMGIKLSRYRLT